MRRVPCLVIAFDNPYYSARIQPIRYFFWSNIALMQYQLKAIDLFASAGGFGLGFRLADYTVTCSIEIDDWAVETLRANNPGMRIIHADVRTFNEADKIYQVCPELPDLIIGGPPCQGFSIAGENDPRDPRNNLFKYFALWVKTLQPRMFVMENVRGLLSREDRDKRKVIDVIQNTFVRLGYATEIWILNAAEYGVPQINTFAKT
jgi:DNA (cytosine-5)-methyltransferase 1